LFGTFGAGVEQAITDKNKALEELIEGYEGRYPLC